MNNPCTLIVPPNIQADMTGVRLARIFPSGVVQLEYVNGKYESANLTAVPPEERVLPDYEPEPKELPMKPLLNDFDGFDRVQRSKTIPGLVAWPTSDGSCRIQCSDRETAKRLAKLPDCNRVGYSVRGAWIQIYALPYTINWVTKKVIDKWTLDFPRKTGVSKTEIASPDAISAGETPTATP